MRNFGARRDLTARHRPTHPLEKFLSETLPAADEKNWHFLGKNAVFQNFCGGAIGPFALVATPIILARFACGASITDMALSLKIKPFVSFLVAYLSRNKHVSQTMRTNFTCAHTYYT